MFKNLRKSEKLRFALLAIFLGIFCGRAPFFMGVFLFFGGLFFWFAIFFKQFWFLILSFVLLGIFWGQFYTLRLKQSDFLIVFSNEIVEIEGEVVNFPEIRRKDMTVRLQVRKIKGKTQKIEGASLGKILLIVSKKETINYGDKIFLIGKLELPRSFSSFDYQAFLLKFGIFFLVRQPQNLQILEKGTGGNFFVLQAKKLRDIFSQNLQKVLPLPHSQISEGVLLGEKKKLPKKIEQDFKNSGLQHLLVVSGFNVTILLIFVSILLRNAGRFFVFFGSIFLLLFFVFMVGFEPSILRAALFGSILSVAILMGRFSDSRNFIFLTAAILALFSPIMIQSDIGFFLSFAATMGIILGVPMLQKLLIFLPQRMEIRTILSVIISAQVSVFPILGFYFGQFPVVGFMANILTEPLIPLVMLFSFLAGVSVFLSEVVAQLFAIPAYVSLEILLLVAQYFGQFRVLVIPKNMVLFSGTIICFFFLWGSFSRKFQEKFLEKNEEDS